jgi:ABC-2 type transport system ATP-binding protein
MLDMADRMCDRMWIIDRGRTIALGSPAEVRAQAGVAANATLEEAFLALVGR